MLDSDAIRSAAVAAHAEAWRLLDLPRRSPGEDEAMVAAAERSLRLWREVGPGVHEQRGLWLVARTALSAGRGDKALHFARQTLSATLRQSSELQDFDLAFGYEIAARAAACTGDRSSAATYFQEAARLGAAIADAEDRQEFLRQFHSGPWFGLNDSRMS